MTGKKKEGRKVIISRGVSRLYFVENKKKKRKITTLYTTKTNTTIRNRALDVYQCCFNQRDTFGNATSTIFTLH